MYVCRAVEHACVVKCAARGLTTYLGAIGVEGGLCIVCFYGLCVELESLVPLLVAEGIVALILELGSFL